MIRSRHPIAEVLLLLLFATAHVRATWFTFTDPAYFTSHYAAEDGPLEYATALLLLIAGIILVRRAVLLGADKPRRYVWLTCLYALAFVFAAGEEVSWGQRIFNWESGDFFVTHNHQAETNLHNLVVGDYHLASTLFGNLLTPVILMYLLVLPLLFGRLRFVDRFVDALAVPVPSARHAVLGLIATLMMGVITLNRQFELYELAFSVIMVMIFLSPRNAAVWSLQGAGAWHPLAARPGHHSDRPAGS